MADKKTLELFKDEGFLKELGAAKTAEEAQKLIEAKGGEITIDELKTIRAMSKQQSGEKLDADELELVAGGGEVGRQWGDALGDMVGETVELVKKLSQIGW